MSKITLQEENNALLKCILEKRFFEPWLENYQTNFNVEKNSIAKDTHLELYITSDCNQNCEYCYLVKHSDLYPKEYRDQDTIINNLNILLNWFINNNYAIDTVELFSGEIWHTKFGEKILETCLQAVDRGFKINQIIIPSNCSFVRSSQALEKIQYFIEHFADYGISLIFSISIDGKIIDNYSRPFNNEKEIKDDDFYEMLFSFARHNHFLFHPMVSAYNVKDWIENFNWWVEMFEEWGGDPEVDIMTLEVRDGDWNSEAIQYYKDFLDMLLEYRISQTKNIEELTKSLFFLDSYQKKQYSIFSPKCDIAYSPIYFPEAKGSSGCTVNTHLTIRLGDLAICPCHRTSYNKYLYGKFIVQNNEIVDIEAGNIQMAVQILFGNAKFNLGCAKCIFKDYCLKGCFGAQIENANDPFVNNPVICNFFKEKMLHLLKRYTELGIIEELKKVSPYSYNFLSVQNFLNFYNEVMKFYELG